MESQAQTAVVGKGAQVVLFVRSWAKLSELAELINKTTGYHSPLFKVNVNRKQRQTEFAFCAVPKWVAEKLLKVPKEILGKTSFEYAKFEKKFDEKARGLYIKVPRQNTQHEWMRRVIRSRVLDMLHQLELRKIIQPKTCYLSKNFRLFVNDPDDKIVETVHAFIDGLAFYSSDRTFYVRAFYLRPRDSKDELGEKSENVDIGTELDEDYEVCHDEYCVDGELM